MPLFAFIITAVLLAVNVGLTVAYPDPWNALMTFITALCFLWCGGMYYESR
jgi:hypothetical protein